MVMWGSKALNVLNSTSQNLVSAEDSAAKVGQRLGTGIAEMEGLGLIQEGSQRRGLDDFRRDSGQEVQSSVYRSWRISSM